MQLRCLCLLYTKKMTKYETIHQTTRAGKKKTEQYEQASAQVVSAFFTVVFTLQKLPLMLQFVHCARQKTSSQLCLQQCNIFQRKITRRNLKKNSKKSAQIRGALHHKLHFGPFYFYVYTHISLLRILASIDWLEMVEDTPIERWLQTSHYIKIALSSTLLKTENHFT